MIMFLSYLLKVGVCIAVFYVANKITLSKETFFKLNRLLLMVSIVLSIILPIWTITIIKETVFTQVPQLSQIIGEGSDITGQIYRNSENGGIAWDDLLPFIGFGIYALGVIIFSVRKVIGFIQISRIMKSSRKEVTAEAKLYLYSKPIIPFSWFGNIIISEEDYIINKEMIIEHEKAHIRLGHSYDLIFINLMTILQWFNPFVWFIRKELVSIHEFQADNHVINKGIDAKKYQYLLISKGTAHCFSLPVVNHLCSGNFKQRIKMMLKKRSNPQSAIKAFLLIPLVAGAIVAFAKTEYVETVPEANASENGSISALAQNLQKQDGFIYFVDGKEASEEVINKMSLSEFVSYKIYKREEAVEKFGEKAKNGAVEIITRDENYTTPKYSKPSKDSRVKRDQILMVTVKSDGSYFLGKWSDKTSDNNTATATKSNIENVINNIIPRMKYSKDSIIGFIKFELQESLVQRFENLSPVIDALVNCKIKKISMQASDNYKKIITISDNKNDSEGDQKNVLVIKINDVGYFLINNEGVKDINKLESVIKSQIEKVKAISNGPINVTIHTSSKTPIEAVNKVNEILKKANITKISYITPKRLN